MSSNVLCTGTLKVCAGHEAGIEAAIELFIQ